MFLLDSLLQRDQVRARPGAAGGRAGNGQSEALQQQLLEAQLHLEEGTIDEATFADIERDVFARVRELRGSEASSGIADASAFDEVEIDAPDADRS